MFCRSLVLLKQPHRSNRSVPAVSQAGFGLIELMVSISIMAIIAAIVFSRQDSFNSAILLRGQAYSIALQLREVQMSAVSATNEAGTDFRNTYGVLFSSDSGTFPTRAGYQIFKDKEGVGYHTGYYDDSGSLGDEALGPEELLDPRFEISAIRLGGVLAVNDYVSIIYERPNFDAVFYDDNSGSLVDVPTVEIDVSRKGATGTGCGDVHTIEVTHTGQISVKKCP